MTVTRAEMQMILARLQKLETRQNLLKNNLLSLKKQVDSLESDFKGRPELKKIKAIQLTLNELAQFGDRLNDKNKNLSKFTFDEAVPTRSAGSNSNIIDTDVLILPITEEDINIDDVLETNPTSNLSSLLGSLGPLEGADGGMVLDEKGTLDDVPMDLNKDLDALDLDNISFEELEQLDLSSMNLDAIDSLGMADESVSDENGAQNNLTDLDELSSIDLEMPELGDNVLSFDDSEAIALQDLDIDLSADIASSNGSFPTDSGEPELDLSPQEPFVDSRPDNGMPSLDVNEDINLNDLSEAELPSLDIDIPTENLALDINDLELESSAEIPAVENSQEEVNTNVGEISPEKITLSEDPFELEESERNEDEAELSEADILKQIQNRQHYFIAFHLPKLQLAQQDLRDCVFDRSHLQNSQFQNSDLRDTTFRESNLEGTNFDHTSLERANFEKANLANASFKGILFNQQTSFKEANLSGADFSELDFKTCPDFKQANLTEAKFAGSNLRGVDCSAWNLSGAKLTRANLINTNLAKANLTNVDLTGAVYSRKTAWPDDFIPKGALLLEAQADLCGVDLQGFDLSRLNLTKANFSGANLEKADLTQSDLSDANLTEANLTRSQLQAICLEANFEKANLTQADLSEANVTASNFRDADFQGATLKNANFTMTNLQGINLQDTNTYRMNCNGADLEGLDLRGVNFEGDLSGANLTNANLQELNLNFLDLSWANLTNADVTGASFKETNLDNANLLDAKGFDPNTYEYIVHLNNTILPNGQTSD